jgi:hypothetical protein
MARAEHIIHQMQKESAGQAKELLAADGDLQVRVKLADSDRLGFLLEKLEMKGRNGHELKLDPVRIEKEVTYLGEPLRIVELEKFIGRAIIRSYPPRMENGTVSFFEMTIDRSEGLSFTRLCYDRGQSKRYPVPASFSRETLERLLSDLVSLVTEN